MFKFQVLRVPHQYWIFCANEEMYLLWNFDFDGPVSQYLNDIVLHGYEALFHIQRQDVRTHSQNAYEWIFLESECQGFCLNFYGH